MLTSSPATRDVHAVGDVLADAAGYAPSIHVIFAYESGLVAPGSAGGMGKAL